MGSAFEKDFFAKDHEVDRTFESLIEKRCVAGFRAHEIRGESRFPFGVEEDQIRGRACGNGRDIEAHEAARLGAEAFDEQVPAESAIGDEVVVEGNQCGIEPGNAIGRGDKILGFFERCVRSVVGGDDIESAVDEALQERFIVRFGAQWRIHFIVGIEIADVLIGEKQMMGGDFCGDFHIATGFPPSDGFHAEF